MNKSWEIVSDGIPFFNNCNTNIHVVVISLIIFFKRFFVVCKYEKNRSKIFDAIGVYPNGYDQFTCQYSSN